MPTYNPRPGENRAADHDTRVAALLLASLLAVGPAGAQMLPPPPGPYPFATDRTEATPPAAARADSATPQFAPLAEIPRQGPAPAGQAGTGGFRDEWTGSGTDTGSAFAPAPTASAADRQPQFAPLSVLVPQANMP